jgi:acyl dehydratase
MPIKQFATLADIQATLGQPSCTSDWMTITQVQVQLFADATGDQQWIHTDPERAASGPFGAPIAHGFLTLSLIPAMFASSMDVPNTKMGVNYGLNKVRFMTPVKVGSRVRAQFKLVAYEALQPAPGTTEGAQMTWEATIELEGGSRPACVAESIVRRYV